MQAILRTAWDLDSDARIIIVAECDYLRTDEHASFDFQYHRRCWAVQRHKLHEGRAMKIFIAKEIEPNVSSIQWLRRSVAITVKSNLDELVLIGSHFGHRDAWEQSLDEVVEHIAGSSARVTLLGDLNIESRHSFQSSQDAARWHSLCGNLQVHKLVQQDLGIEYTRRAKLDGQLDSRIDHIFSSASFFTRCGATWEGAPGDHCWLKWCTPFRCEWRRQPARRWRCDWDAFCAFVETSSPDSFGAWDTVEDWLSGVVDRFSIKSSRRERRQHWEPFRIKMLRFKIRQCQDDTERNQLSKRLFKMRKQWAAEREKVQLREDLKFGKNPHKRPSNLYPVVELLGNQGSTTRQPAAMACIVEHEFQRRWSGPPDYVEPPVLQSEVAFSSFELGAIDVRAAVKKIPRPWIKDCRGIPPIALLSSTRLLQAIINPLERLLGSDAGWEDLHEEGFVKQKVSGGVDPKKLRALVPQSTGLRLLSNLVKAAILPLVDQYSCDHSFTSRVLGGGKGGQTLDIAACAKLALELGRDANDQAAVAQMDVSNYHDSFDRMGLLQSLRRRRVPLNWALAAVRIQRCARVCLRVGGVKTLPLARNTGALTGNNLAPIFGRIVMEDAFSIVDPMIERYVFKLCDITLLPMAWSDNIVVYANTVQKAAKVLALIEDSLFQLGGYKIKDGSVEIVPACTRRLTWKDVRVDGLRCAVVDSCKLIGYTITCNGDVSTQKSRMIGTLRGLLASARKTVGKPGVPSCVRARWWRGQLQGLLGYSAAFIGPSKSTFRDLEVVGNGGARLIAGLSSRYLIGDVLERVQNENKTNALVIFSEFIVRWLGHVFRHPQLPVFAFLSRPLEERLTALRVTGRRAEISDYAWNSFQFLQTLGFSGNPPVGGYPQVRGHTGHVFRWGAGWFSEIGDRVGWEIERTDKPEVAKRVEFLLQIFQRSRIAATLDAICDSTPMLQLEY